ncbi:MAG: YbbR-like domain-containing protein [Deltaproteobacteria bacterium]|nr:YbbR-like domain-containing protein [Deltaproteobacteria bacterium]
MKIGPQKRKRTFREVVMNNIGLKLASLITAIVLFSLVRGAEDAQRSVFVDVVALLPAPNSGKMLVSELPDQVRLTLKGSRSQINAIRPENIPPVQIDLTDTDLRYYYFADDEFDVPAGVTITQVGPTSIALDWASRQERPLPIQPRLVGQPPDGLVLGEPARAEPAEVVVVGPDTEVADLRAVQTDPVDLSQIQLGRNELGAALVRPPPHTRYQGEPNVTVVLEVVRDLAERTIPGVTVEVEGPGRAEPAQVSVMLRGAPTAVEMVDPARISATADLSNLDPALGGAVPVVITGLPDGVEAARVEPASVEIAASN